jgi:hypothetical protein
LREAYNPELLEDIKTKKLVETSFGCGLDGRDLEFSTLHLYQPRKKFFSLPKGSLDDYRDIDVEPEEFRAFLPSMNDLRKGYRSPDKALNDALNELYEEAWVERTTIVVSSDPIQHRKTLFYVAKAKSGVEIEEAPLNLPALNPSFDHSAELESTYRYWLPLRDVCQACKLDYKSIDKVRKSLSFKSIRYQRRDSSNQ